jgi:signal transduction histidine kinase
VIFCTANYAEGEVERLAAACGVSDFITKPSDPESVVAKVGEVLGSPRTLPAPVAAEDFDREQLRVVNDKLVEKVGQLEAVSAERRKVLAQLISAHEDERRQVAEELHDDSIQGVAALGLHLGMLAERTDLEPDVAAALRRLQGDATTAISGLRRMLFELQPIELDHGGLAPALEVVLQHALQEDELEYVFVDHTAREASAPTRTLLYRAAREALANVRKHAGAANVQVTLDEQDGGFMVTVSDDGTGFDSAQALRVRPGHLGLAAIRERVEVAGGRLRLDGRAGAGTFEVWVPELAPAPVQS